MPSSRSLIILKSWRECSSLKVGAWMMGERISRHIIDWRLVYAQEAWGNNLIIRRSLLAPTRIFKMQRVLVVRWCLLVGVVKLGRRIQYLARTIEPVALMGPIVQVRWCAHIARRASLVEGAVKVLSFTQHLIVLAVSASIMIVILVQLVRIMLV